MRTLKQHIFEKLTVSNPTNNTSNDKKAKESGNKKVEKVIKKYVSDKEYAVVAENLDKLKGFDTKIDWDRVYNYGNTFRSILGSVSTSENGIPLNSRASLIYNEFIKKHNLEGSFNLIQAGDKIKYIYLKTPNTLGETIKNTTGRTIKSSYPDVIAFTDDNFIQYFKDYIDYDTQFEKSFIKPLEFMTNAINFTVKEKAMDLFDF